MYAELHARSAFSFLEGAVTPEELASVCSALGMSSMALLDRDGLYGAPRFYLAAQKIGIRTHIGAEVSCVKGWRYSLLVTSPEGYKNLCRLITRMKLGAAKGEGAIETNELEHFNKGLVCLTGGDEGPLAHALRAGGREDARKCLEQLCAIFGRENVYVELQRHLYREEEKRNQAAVEIARKLSLPLLATNGVCYATPREPAERLRPQRLPQPLRDPDGASRHQESQCGLAVRPHVRACRRVSLTTDRDLRGFPCARSEGSSCSRARRAVSGSSVIVICTLPGRVVRVPPGVWAGSRMPSCRCTWSPPS